MDEALYIKRTLEHIVSRLNEQFSILLITGARQVGKSTLLKHLGSKNRTYVTLDDPLVASVAKTEPRFFLERFKPPLLIDEVQYAPELFPFLKMYVDSNKTPGQIWLTGSQQFGLMKGVTESLAGRVCIFNMFGMSLFEQDNLANQHTPFLPVYAEVMQRASGLVIKSLPEIYSRIWRGSFPEMVLNQDKDWNAFYSSYVQTYLQRDVRDLARVGDETAFLRFLRAAAARTGQLLNVADLSRDADISPVTGKAWLSILEASGIIYLLEPYHSNITKRIVKAKKLYFTDTGLCCYLTGWSSPETLELGAMSGAMLETFVIMEIIKSYVHNGKQPALYYYRDKDQKEIDALILQDQTIYPIEIKKTAMPSQQHSKHFGALNALKMKVGDGGLICLTDTLIRISENLTAIPVSMV